MNKISDFWTLEELKELFETKEEITSRLDLLLKDRNYHIDDNLFYIDDKTIIDLEKFKNYPDIDKIIPEDLKTVEDWKRDVCIAGSENSGDRKIWLSFIKDIRRLYDLTNMTKDQLFKKDVVYKDIDVSTAKKLITALKKGIEKPGFFFKHRLRKARREISDKVTINNRILETLYDCNVALEYTNLTELKENTKNTWDILMTGTTLTDKENNKNLYKQLYSYAEQMEYLLNWYDREKKSFLHKIENAGFEKIDFNKTEGSPIHVDEINQILDFIPSLIDLITIGKVALEYREIYKKRSDYLEKIENLIKDHSPLGKEIENAVLNEDTDKYSKTLEKLRVLSEKEVLYKKYKTLLNDVKTVASSWGDELENGLFNDKIENI